MTTFFKTIGSFFSSTGPLTDEGQTTTYRKTTKAPLPSVFHIDICNICNLKCPFCPTGLNKSGLTKTKMNLEDYSKIFDKIKDHASQIFLFNWGEPFLNNDIIPIITMTAKHGISTVVHSNLTMKEFSDHEADELVLAGLSLLSVSLDGASQETYERYRQGGNFERVINNIKKIQQAKKRHNISLPVRWQFLINAFNEHEQDKAIEMAKDLGIAIYFDLMGINKDPSWASSLHFNKKNEAWPKIIFEPESSYSLYSDHTTPVSLPQTLPSFCKHPFAQMTINANGDVMPCCTVYGDKYKVGNILESSLKQIWYGEELKRCRQFLGKYGPKQNTGAICETMPCKVLCKNTEQDSDGGRVDLKIELHQGAWREREDDWFWVSNKSKFKITPHFTGILSFCLIIPNADYHKDIVPIHTTVLCNNHKIFQSSMESVGQYTISTEVQSGKSVDIKIECDKYIVPHEHCRNGDNRKLSLIIDCIKIEDNNCWY